MFSAINIAIVFKMSERISLCEFEVFFNSNVRAASHTIWKIIFKK